MDLSSWWEVLSLLQKSYWVVASFSTVLFIIQMAMMFAGGDADDLDFDADGDFDGDHGAGIDVFSVKSVLSFLMFFGWSGLAAIELGMTAWWASMGISFVAGLIMMFLTAWILMLFIKLQESGTMKIETAIGKTGEVYFLIPAERSALGKIQIVVNGSYKTLDAVTEDSEDILTGTAVEVVKVEGSTLVVKRKR